MSYTIGQSTLGVDISKSTLDICLLPGGHEHQFANNRQGFAVLVKWLVSRPVDRIVYEATGHYHLAFEQALHRKKLPLVKVNPLQARRFAEACGKLAKTDRVDAAMLARFGGALDMKPQDGPSEKFHELKELYRARHALIKDRTATKNRQKALTINLLKRQNEQRLGQIKRHLQQVEATIMATIMADAVMAQNLDILLSIPGVGEAAAMALLIDCPEIGTIDAKQIASLAGVAPVTRQSGTWKGKSHIRGGRARLREALYLPALVAARFNPDMESIYVKMTTAGKPPKVAITAIMRRLIILANALIRDQREWKKSIA